MYSKLALHLQEAVVHPILHLGLLCCFIVCVYVDYMIHHWILLKLVMTLKHFMEEVQRM